MTVLYQDSFDLYDDLADFDANVSYRAGSWTNWYTTGGRFNGSRFHTGYGAVWYQSVIVTSTVLFGFAAVYFEAQPNDYYLSVMDNAGNIHASLRFVTGKIAVYDAAGVQQDISTEEAPSDAWLGIQWKFVSHETAGSFEVWINGDQHAVATNIDTIHSGAAAVGRIQYKDPTGANPGTYFDDPMIWDDNGTGMNGWTDGKDLRIDVIRPNADTAQEDFTPLGAGDQYVEIDEEPSHDGDTSYNESTGSGDVDRVELEALAGTPASIYNCRARVVAKKTDAGVCYLQVGVYSGTTEGMSGDQGLGTGFSWFNHDNELNPDDSAAWELADVNALQLQYEHV